MTTAYDDKKQSLLSTSEVRFVYQKNLAGCMGLFMCEWRSFRGKMLGA